MKKIYLCLVLLCAMTVKTQADEPKTIVTTFYGTKARNNANNPCKGATTRVCGKIETTFYEISEDQTLVTTTKFDRNGNITSIDNKLEPGSTELIKQQKILEFKRYTNAKVENGND